MRWTSDKKKDVINFLVDRSMMEYTFSYNFVMNTCVILKNESNCKTETS